MTDHPIWVLALAAAGVVAGAANVWRAARRPRAGVMFALHRAAVVALWTAALVLFWVELVTGGLVAGPGRRPDLTAVGGVVFLAAVLAESVRTDREAVTEPGGRRTALRFGGGKLLLGLLALAAAGVGQLLGRGSPTTELVLAGFLFAAGVSSLVLGLRTPAGPGAPA